MKIEKNNVNYNLIAFASKMQKQHFTLKTEKGVGKIVGDQFYITDGKVMIVIDVEGCNEGMHRIVKQDSNYLLIPAPDVEIAGCYGVYENIETLTAGLTGGDLYVKITQESDDETYSTNIFRIMEKGACFNFAKYLPKKVLASFDGVRVGEPENPLIFENSGAEYYVMPVKL